MAIDPFGVSGRYRWEHNYETLTDRLYDALTGDVLLLSEAQSEQMRNARYRQQELQNMAQQYMNSYGYMAPLWGSRAEPASESVKDKLLRTNYQRWRRRMLRIREKVWEQRLGKMANLGWYVACGWGAVIATMFSIKLIKWLFTMILG